MATPNAVADSIFDDIAKAKATQTGNWFRSGKYLLDVLKLLVEKKRNGLMFIAEFEVLESVQTEPSIVPNPVGSTVSYAVNLGDADGMGMGNMKQFAMSLWNAAEHQISGEVLKKMCNQNPQAPVSPEGVLLDPGSPRWPVQPCRHWTIRDEVYEKPQKKNPAQKFTHHRWEHVPPDLAAIAVRIAAEAAGK